VPECRVTADPAADPARPASRPLPRRRFAARRWLATRIDQEAGERQPVALRMKRLAAVAQECRHALEVAEQGELARRVIPFVPSLAPAVLGARLRFAPGVAEFSAHRSGRSTAALYPSEPGATVLAVLVAGKSKQFEALQVAPGTGDAYWTVVDNEFRPVGLADDYLRELRLGRRRVVSTTKAYAENLAVFFDWLIQTGRPVEEAPRQLGRFVHWLQTAPVTRPGTGVGKPRSASRINAILVSVRELYKHAVSMGSVDPAVLTALYIAGDDRLYPDRARREDGAVRAVLRPLHRVPVTRRASVGDVKPDEFAALVDACEHWRDRFLLGVMYFGGLRHGEALGLRLPDLHFAESSGELGCHFPGPHLHVVPRVNANGACVKNERGRTVPVDTHLVGAFDHYLRRERDLCPAAAACDFLFVNLWHEPLGAPMKVSRVHKLFRSLSRRAALDRLVHPHMLRHSAGTAWAAAEGVDAAQVLLGHVSASSSEVYIHPLEERQRRAVREMSRRFDGARSRRG
jgi:integrase/recombinase XerD